MGRLQKIKRELVLEANRRLLGEQNITGAHCWGDSAMGGNGSPCECKPIYPHPIHQYGPPATYTTLEKCWNDSSNCCSGPNANIKYRVRLQGCPGGRKGPGGGMDWGLFNLRAKLDGQPVQPSDINKVVSLDGWYDHNGPDPSGNFEVIGCCKITGVEYWEPNSYSDAMAMLPLVTDSNCDCKSRKRYRCKGPVQQATAIRERANFDNTSSCVEDPNGEFKSLQDCQENCESGYGPGYEPDVGTTEG